MKILTWSELVNAYDDDQQPFEAYFCSEMGIHPEGVFNADGTVADDAFAVLDRLYGAKKFCVRPNADYIRWWGKLNSDFSVSVEE